jgi:hypothetical protein
LRGAAPERQRTCQGKRVIFSPFTSRERNLKLNLAR